MKIRVISTAEEIFCLKPTEKIVHMSFRPSNQNVLALIERCPKLEAIELPDSYCHTISKAIKTYLQMQRVTILEGQVWGHRKDISEYYVIPQSIRELIEGLIEKNKPMYEIKNAVSKTHTISPATAEYFIKTELKADIV
jgi:hypothetical protein